VSAIFLSKKNYGFCILFFVIILYFSLLTGSVAYARFRIPITPYLFLLGVFGVTILWRTVRARFFNE